MPEIAVDPDSGTTLGVIPTWVKTDENNQVRRIIAPDLIYNAHFGWGTHGRIYGYTSGDEQWSLVAGVKERVEREFDAEYQRGRLREERWSFSASVVYDVDGTPRFYGFGNNSPASAVTNYTNQQERVEMQVGLNLTHAWQLRYTGRLQVVDVLPGTLEGVASIEPQFLGTNKLLLNRLSIVYDTRDDLTVPSRGMELIAYGGLASRNGLLNDSMYSEVGADGRIFSPVAENTILVAHMAANFIADGEQRAVLGSQQHRRRRERGRRRTTAARLRRRALLRSRFLRRQCGAAPQVFILQRHDRGDGLGHSLHRYRPGISGGKPGRSRWINCTMSAAWVFAASRAPSWSAMSISATAARESPRSRASITPSKRRLCRPARRLRRRAKIAHALAGVS